MRLEFTLQQGLILQAAEKVGHPLGDRKTDLVLANAIMTGHCGRARPAEASLHVMPLRQRREHSLSDAATELQLAIRRGIGFRQAYQRWLRTWRLYRAQQVDQNGYPACVGATEEHWEKSLPVYHRKGLGFLEMYRRAKLIDGYAGDGTDVVSMFEVCRELGLIEGDPWWWNGPHDNEAADYWLLNKGGLWVGWNIPESMFRADPVSGAVEVTGPYIYGHEMFFVGTDRKEKVRWGVQSWGRRNYGISGRFKVRDEQWDRLMANGGDCQGVMERAA
jgi:hypothetical protein